MKRNTFILLFIVGLFSITEINAQYRHHDGRRYRYAPRPYIRVIPRIVVPRVIIPTPSFGFSWGYGSSQTYIAPPPIIIGGGRGWRHYHRHGYVCNDRCHRWSDDNYYRNQDRRYYDDDRRYNNDRDRRYYEQREDNNRRYEDNDRYYNRLNTKPSDNQPQQKTYNTDEDYYEDENDTR